MANKFKGWNDGRAQAETFAELALKRAEQSQSPYWRVNPNSNVPVFVQYWFWKVVLWTKTLLSKPR